MEEQYQELMDTIQNKLDESYMKGKTDLLCEASRVFFGQETYTVEKDYQSVYSTISKSSLKPQEAIDEFLHHIWCEKYM